MDLLQSLSGLLLGLFMWLHMFFVSSILLGEDAMWTVARFFEGYFFFGKPPALAGFIVRRRHLRPVRPACLAGRAQVPDPLAPAPRLLAHMRGMRHEDTTLWFVQVITGFGMFFLAPVHLYAMMTHPELIGPYESADRVWSGGCGRCIWPAVRWSNCMAASASTAWR
jgi:fumarate reductase subunit C